MEHLHSRGKGKNWFDTMRTEYGMIHKPIIKPYDKFSARGKSGRRVFYLKAIIPFLDEIIDLHDKDGYTLQRDREINERQSRCP